MPISLFPPMHGQPASECPSGMLVVELYSHPFAGPGILLGGQQKYILWFDQGVALEPIPHDLELVALNVPLRIEIDQASTIASSGQSYPLKAGFVAVSHRGSSLVVNQQGSQQNLAAIDLTTWEQARYPNDWGVGFRSWSLRADYSGKGTFDRTLYEHRDRS